MIPLLIQIYKNGKRKPSTWIWQVWYYYIKINSTQPNCFLILEFLVDSLVCFSVNFCAKIILEIFCLHFIYFFCFFVYFLLGLGSQEDLRLDLAGGRDDLHCPSDKPIYVSSIAKGSFLEGKLK